MKSNPVIKSHSNPEKRSSLMKWESEESSEEKKMDEKLLCFQDVKK
jgi:hypothetical protein